MVSTGLLSPAAPGLGGDHQVVCWVLAAGVLTLAAAFILGFPAAGLVAVVDLGSGLLDLPVFLVAVTLVCLGASVIG